MAGEDRTAIPDVIQDLLAEPRAFEFFQVFRLLRLTGRDGAKPGHPVRFDRRIRTHPNLTLKFPESDVELVEVNGDQTYQITANFLGLYGTSSPLPTFYTEDLIDERLRDLSAAREFIDVLNDGLFPLLFDAWNKSRAMLKLVEEQDRRPVEGLFALIGLGDARLRHGIKNPQRLLRYLGLFTLSPRSALGLQTLLADALGNVPVRIISCRATMVDIPPDQRLMVGENGCLLGESSFIGEEIEDRSTCISVHIGPLPYNQFRELLPGADHYKTLKFLTEFYPLNPVRVEVELILTPSGAAPICLGGSDHSRLGLDTWLFSGEYASDMRASFWL